MSDKNCKDCKFSISRKGDFGTVYICKRFPPTMFCDQYGHTSSSFPRMDKDDWCWEFKKK